VREDWIQAAVRSNSLVEDNAHNVARLARASEEGLDGVDALFVPTSPALPVQPILDHGLQVINRASVGAWKLESLAQNSSPRTTFMNPAQVKNTIALTFLSLFSLTVVAFSHVS